VHVPPVGPPVVPVRQERSSPHQPQPFLWVQSWHIVLEAQGSAGQAIAVKSHSAHMPSVGPEEVPEWHRLVE
jgi:hypothetical protein